MLSWFCSVKSITNVLENRSKIQVNEVDALLQHLSDTVVDTNISLIKRYFTDSAWTMVLQLGKYFTTKFQYKSKLIHPSCSEKGRVEM